MGNEKIDVLKEPEINELVDKVEYGAFKRLEYYFYENTATALEAKIAIELIKAVNHRKQVDFSGALIKAKLIELENKGKLLDSGDE